MGVIKMNTILIEGLKYDNITLIKRYWVLDFDIL